MNEILHINTLSNENETPVCVLPHVTGSAFRLLDCGCKAGGSSKGYYDAGFKVTGLDIEEQPKFPNYMEFIKGDFFNALKDIDFISQFDAIHAGPICKRYSSITKTAGTNENWPDQIGELRDLLIKTGKLFIIENVPGAPLNKPFMLCGTMFGLNIIRHRLFETNWTININPWEMRCQHMKRVVKHGRKPDENKHYAAATGHFSGVDFVSKSMDIDWMGQAELSQAIPPAFTNYIGKQLIGVLEHYR